MLGTHEIIFLVCTSLVVSVVLVLCGGCHGGGSARQGGGGSSFRWISGNWSGEDEGGMFENVEDGIGGDADGGVRVRGYEVGIEDSSDRNVRDGDDD